MRQPGFVGGYHAQDSQTLKSVSITVWDSKESMMALKDRSPPGGPVGITTDWQELYDVVEEFQGVALYSRVAEKADSRKLGFRY